MTTATESAPPAGGIAAVDPRTILGSGDTPRPSDVTTRSSAPTTSVNESSGLLDREGTVFDRAKHQVDPFGNPKKTAKGTWAKKTGNGALRLQGRPMTGRLATGGRPAAEQPAAPAAAEQLEQPATTAPLEGGSTFVPPRSPPPTAGQAGTVDGVPLGADDAIPLTAEEYRPTAQALAKGSLGIARMWRGDHWQATPGEESQLVDSLSRVWAAYQLPRLGPVFELLMVLVGFIAAKAERVGDTRKLWDWLLGKRKPALQDPAPASSAPTLEPARA